LGFIILALALATAALGQSLEDRALRISGEIAERNLPFGSILNPMYASADSTQLVTYTRCGDSAIWTGHYLAAESFRFAVTRTPEAREAALRALRGVKALVDVTAPHNLVARCVLRPDSPLAAGPRSEEAQHGEYLGQVEGVDHYWIGHTSRDQYMGVFFGLSVAYEHLDDPGARALIADLVTRLIDRLLARDWNVVMPDGRTSTVFWIRPDQQLSILQVGRQVNPARFGPIYDRTSGGLIGIATPIRIEVADPHESYFKFNLAAITFYNLIRLEPENSRRRGEYLEAYGIFRRAVERHGNAFFNVVDRALTGRRTDRDAETMELLSAWLLRPRRDEWVDLRGRYRACGSDRACDPIPVVERVRTDFLWQRSPFLLYGGGEGKIESPGIDFILPYWMGRFYGMELSLMAVSSASGAAVLAPDSLGSVFGSGFMVGSRIDVRDAAGVVRPASVLFTSASQINFLVPDALAAGPARVAVVRPDGSESHATIVSIARVAPALFSASANGRGPAAAVALRVETDGRQVAMPVFRCDEATCQTVEIDIGSGRAAYLSLYGTGLRNATSVSVTAGGRVLPVLYAGRQPSFAGLDQVNVQLTPELRGAGRADVVVTADGVASNAVQIEID
jgi:uncharacterized protein (TIGR03437 family)